VAARLSGKVGVFAQPDQRHPPTDVELVRGIVDGERWAADALYELLYPAVARGLQRVLHDEGSDYEDLVQATFERIVGVLLENRAKAVMSLTAWASGIASHVALDSLRSKIRERRRVRSDDAAINRSMNVAAAEPSGERLVDSRRQLAVVRAVLAAMKNELAETVVLHDLVGHDLVETAAIMRVSVAAAQSRLVRGRKELLRRVQPRLDRENR
jgi:RNA polymerase sigma-70 factor (ECF subfamily)